MLTIIVHLFIHDGQEVAFAAYEAEALQIFRSHGGRLIRAIRPQPTSADVDTPYEIHVLEIPAAQWPEFLADPRRQALSQQQQTIFRDTTLFIAETTVSYDA